MRIKIITFLALTTSCLFNPQARAHDIVDAAVFNSKTQTYYFFFDGGYVSKGFGEDLGNSLPLTRFGGNFPDTWRGGIDAAVFDPDSGRYFFFRFNEGENDWQYTFKDFGPGENFSAPTSLDNFAANDFPPQCRADAAIFDPRTEESEIDGVYYFFGEDGSFCSLEQGANEDYIVHNGPFNGNYPNPNEFPLKAIAFRSRTSAVDRFYFFSTNAFVRLDADSADFTGTLDTRSAWPGWPAAHGVPSPVQPVQLTLPEALFTDPETHANGGISLELKDRLLELINAASGELTLGVYQLDDVDVQNALIQAHQRGVRVWVLTDEDEERDKPDTFANRDRNLVLQGQVDFLHFVSTNGFIHNKVALFSHIETNGPALENVISSSSSNYMPSSYKKFQDTLTVSDKDMYAAFVEQRDNIVRDDKSYIEPMPGATDEMKAYFFPGDKVGEDTVDTVADILQDLRDNTTNGSLETMRVSINMGSWTASRIAIPPQLKAISELPGGSVRIIASGWKGAVEAEAIRNAIGDGNVAYNFLPGPANDPKKYNAHSKYMLVEVGYRDDANVLTRKNIVYAGSENFTKNALTRHFESWIKIINPEIFPLYEKNFDEIWYQSGRVFHNGFE